MCVALPGKVVKIEEDNVLVDFSGNIVKAVSGLVKLEVGDYCLVHAGCVIQKVSNDEALELISLMKELEG